MQEYQLKKYPELENSLPNHRSASQKTQSKEDEKNIKRNERTSVKNDLLRLLEMTLASSNTSEHFLDQLRVLGHEPYYRNGRLQGIKYNGSTKFRLGRLGFDKKLEELNMEKAMEEKELNELQELRRGRRSRTIEQKQEAQPEKMVSFSEATRGMNEEEKRDVEQVLVNRNLEFEQQNGIVRDGSTPVSDRIANNEVVTLGFDKLYDECQKERADSIHRSSNYYDRGKFNHVRYSAHTHEELMKLNNDRFESIDAGHVLANTMDSEEIGSIIPNDRENEYQDVDELDEIRQNEERELDELDLDDNYWKDR